MPIHETTFENEKELDDWVFLNLSQFLGDCVVLGKFQLTTVSGKGAVPDGIAFNFENRQWHLIEAELSSHGVWPHIAEQITRFVVALKNPGSLRKIRDRLFEHLVKTNGVDAAALKLNVEPHELLREIELFVEGVSPSIAIFIDESTQDLEDFTRALETQTSVYRVKKLLVDGQPDCYSPDVMAPIVSTAPEEKATPGAQDLDIVNALGGGSIVRGKGGFKAYQTGEDRIVLIKRSKFYEQQNYYWYGLNRSTLEQAIELGVTHIIFVMGNWGFVVVPLDIVRPFCEETGVSKNPDGSVRHYHITISPEPNPTMFWSSSVPKYDLTEFAHEFD